MRVSGVPMSRSILSCSSREFRSAVGSRSVSFHFVPSKFIPCAGIGELKNVNFKLYPNPNNGLFTVEFNALQKESIDISVVNQSGVTVYTLSNLEVSGSVSRNIDLGTLPQGTYFFRISNGNDSAMRKFVIQK